MEARGLAIVVVVLVIAGVLFLFRPGHKVQVEDLSKVKSADYDSKKVILVVVDSLLSDAIDQGVRKGELPTLQHIITHGQYHKELVSSFPTMSVAIDSTILTGEYPDKHKVPGLIWFNTESDSLINYGTGPEEIMRQGINPVLYHALIALNGEHLSPNVSTIYEDLNRMGKTAGSINGLVYRGMKEHTLTVPPWFAAFTVLPSEFKVKGPDLLALGKFSEPLGDRTDLVDDPFHRLGLNNDYSVETASYLIRNRKLPDFLYVYLPDLDKQLHQSGPPGESDPLIEFDKQLNRLLTSFGSMEQASEQAVTIIMGDSGVSGIRSGGDNPIIELVDLLDDYSIGVHGEPLTEQTDIILAVNETMAYVYKRHNEISTPSIADKLLKDDRVDFAAWKEGEWIRVRRGTGQELRYKHGGKWTDSYRQAWTLEGSPEVLDIKMDGSRKSLGYSDYPDGLERLASALNSHTGDFVIVCAKPGYELADRASPHHDGGGAHGSLHKVDTMSPLLIYGTDRKPEHMRMVDLKKYLLQLMTTTRLE